MMSLNEILDDIKKSYIILDLKANNKQEAISEMLIYADTHKSAANNAINTIDLVLKYFFAIFSFSSLCGFLL